MPCTGVPVHIPGICKHMCVCTPKRVLAHTRAHARTVCHAHIEADNPCPYKQAHTYTCAQTCVHACRYLAPELLNGRYAEVGLDKADMFALGATLYELATVSGHVHARACALGCGCVCVRARPAANVLGATVCKLGTRGARACRACRACSHCCTNVIEQTSARTRAWALPVLDTHACARTRARMPFAGKCAHTNACMHARSHARTHTHMHRHTCTRMMHMRTTGHINLCTCRAWASLPVGSASTPSARVSS